MACKQYLVEQNSSPLLSLLPLTCHSAILAFSPWYSCSLLLSKVLHMFLLLTIFSPFYPGNSSSFFSSQQMNHSSNISNWFKIYCGIPWTTHFSFMESFSCNLNLWLCNYCLSLILNWKQMMTIFLFIFMSPGPLCPVLVQQGSSTNKKYL